MKTEDGKAVYIAHDNILAAPTEAERERWGKELFRLQAENLWTIGIVVDVPAPFIYSRSLGNIAPAKTGQRTSSVATSSSLKFEP